MRILIADDDRALSQLLMRGLLASGYDVALAHDGDTALKMFLQNEPELLILDLEMPDRSGLDVLHAVRSIAPLCPVIILSGTANTRTRIACLDAGADDCMEKPFSIQELRARCRTALRRVAAYEQAWRPSPEGLEELDGPSTICSGELRMRRSCRQVAMKGVPIRLTNREYELLEQLLLAQGAAVSRSRLLRAVWGEGSPETNALDVHLAALRRKLLPWQAKVRIETERGSGFRIRTGFTFVPPQEDGLTSDARQGVFG